jgi:hypothetical protein
VFYSDTAAPLIEEIVREAKAIIAEELQAVGKTKHINMLCQNPHIARRYEALLDLIGK